MTAKLCKSAAVELSYTPGLSRPTSILVNTFGTGKDDAKLQALVEEKFDLRPVVLSPC